MKKKEKFLAVLLTVCVGLCGICIFQMTTVSAATATLSAKSITLAAGGKKVIKLTGGSGQWSVEDSSIATLKSPGNNSVTVVPKSAGSTVVTCNVGGKALTCKVKVLNNEVGNAEDERGVPIVVGKTAYGGIELDEGEELLGIEYDKTMAKIKVVEQDGNMIDLKFKALKPGVVNIVYNIGGGEPLLDSVLITPGFRGKDKIKKTKKNYKKWRKNFIESTVQSDMTTWEIIDAVGYLISTGKYGTKGGTDGMQLWYGGNGTCVSGAKMMNDFLNDLGINSKVKFTGNDLGGTDIYGYSIMYMSDHRSTKIKLGKKKYMLNPQPGTPWPMGIIEL